MRVKHYRDLIAWQLAMGLAKVVYEATQPFPKEEQYGLTAQMRRAAVSIPCNIAEGQARRSTADFVRFLAIALGSLAELETQIILSQELGFVTPEVANGLLDRASEIGRVTNGLISSLGEH